MPGTVATIPLSLHLSNYREQLSSTQEALYKTESQVLAPAPEPYSPNPLNSHVIKYLGITFISQYKYRVARAGNGDGGERAGCGLHRMWQHSVSTSRLTSKEKIRLSRQAAFMMGEMPVFIAH